VGHGHAAGAGPTLKVAIEAEVKEAGVEDDDCEGGEHKPESRRLEQARAGGSGGARGLVCGDFGWGQTAISGRCG